MNKRYLRVLLVLQCVFSCGSALSSGMELSSGMDKKICHTDDSNYKRSGKPNSFNNITEVNLRPVNENLLLIGSYLSQMSRYDKQSLFKQLFGEVADSEDVWDALELFLSSLVGRFEIEKNNVSSLIKPYNIKFYTKSFDQTSSNISSNSYLWYDSNSANGSVFEEWNKFAYSLRSMKSVDSLSRLWRDNNDCIKSFPDYISDAESKGDYIWWVFWPKLDAQEQTHRSFLRRIFDCGDCDNNVEFVPFVTEFNNSVSALGVNQIDATFSGVGDAMVGTGRFYLASNNGMDDGINSRRFFGDVFYDSKYQDELLQSFNKLKPPSKEFCDDLSGRSNMRRIRGVKYWNAKK